MDCTGAADHGARKGAHGRQLSSRGLPHMAEERAGRPIAGGLRPYGPQASARNVGIKVGRNSRGTKARPTRPAYRKCYGAFGPIAAG